MKYNNISQNVVWRMIRYFRVLDELLDQNVEAVSSAELGKRLNLNPSQIRNDFSQFGEFGQQGYGYNVALLRDAVASILGVGSGFTAVLFGAGNLGHALLKNFGFNHYGFRMLAAFDVDPAVVGTSIEGIPVYSISEFRHFTRENCVDMAVLSVPTDFAVSVAQNIAAAGVKAIWNFTNVELAQLCTQIIVEDIHFSDNLLTLSYHLMKSIKDS